MKKLRAWLAVLLLVAMSVLPVFSAATAHALGTNLIANASAETADTTNNQLAQDWLMGGWGTNTSTLTYDKTAAHTGSASLKVQTTSYTDGDAKWYFKPVAITAGSTYTFSDYYQSTVASSLVAQYDNGSGSMSYAELTSLPVAATWQQATASFKAPATAKFVTIFHLINAVGTLQIDDASLTANVVAPAPTVAVTAPTANSTVTGTTQLTATATDSVAVAGVQFKVDGVNVGSEVTSAPYQTSWNTTTLSNGNHTVTAVVRNRAAITVTSSPVTVNVQNVVTPPADGNLIANPSFEVTSADPLLPASWQTSGWGTNTTTFSFLHTAGHTGNSSAKVQTTAYTNGDAKWSFAPVAVTGGTKFKYTNYYKANVATTLVAQFTDANGANTFQTLTSVPTSTAWKQTSTTFTVPMTAKSLTVFHVLNAVGYVQIDDITLTPVALPADGNIIPNFSLETISTANKKLPENWNTSTWGTNTTTFTYPTNGRTGTHSVKVQTTSYTSGSSYWYFDNQPVVGGGSYSFVDYYKSNIISEVDAAFLMADGTTVYQYLGAPSPSKTEWTRFERQFTAPAGAVSVSMYHNIYGVGYLQIDDLSMTPYAPVGFNRALITITNDDGYASYYNYGLPLLNKYGFTATDYIISGMINNDPGYMTTAMLTSLKNAGHEIGSHSVTHPDVTTLSATKLDNELKNSDTALLNWVGVPINAFASPYGAYNQTAVTNAKKYYTSYRGVQAGFNAKNNFDVYNIRVQNLVNTTTLAEVQSWITEAKNTNTWLVLVYHQIDPNPTDPVYNTTPTDFDAQLAAIAASGVAVKSIAQALAELQPQL